MILLWALPALGQKTDTTAALPQKTRHHINKTIEAQQALSARLKRQQLKLITKLRSVEIKAGSQLKEVDSIAAMNYLQRTNEVYGKLLEKFNRAGNTGADGVAEPYIPRLDSLQCLVNFLGAGSEGKEHVTRALKNIGGLKSDWLRGESIKSFLAERGMTLKGLQEQYPQLGSIKGAVAKYSKELVYYRDRLSNWKEELNKPANWEATALKALNKVPVFQKFLRENSQLASLFGMQTNTAPDMVAIAMNGMQTRATLQTLLQERLGPAAANLEQQLASQAAAPGAGFTDIRNKITSLRSAGMMDDDASAMPSSGKNNQRTKPFLKRLEYGFDLQTGKRSAYQFPASNDLALSLGYRLNDRLVTGVGVAYKFSLGEAWNKLNLTHDGIGLRSYLDWKLTAAGKGNNVLFGNIWISGGLEQNYLARFESIAALRNLAWQTSGLVGVSKKIRYRKKTAKLQLLWDFLHPAGNRSVVFRWGYTF
ncbi:hypothetical protein [Chitinophaga polysaccharea]|uniref:hypothetical protein n=1 Tax=Chitinophaga polysaccharea TaxID=1293035 RepID=UPI00115A90C6|nr:hypothetical protein [Chitinophaga polysaccharea]